jgi:sec-independent protein translocase protein TatB
MFGIGMPEMLLILAIALVVIGPKKLPDLAKSIGRAMGEFKKATNEIKESMDVDSSLKEVKDTFSDINNDIKESISFDTIEDYKPKKKDISESATKSASDKMTPPPLDTDQTMGDLKDAFDNLKTDEDTPTPSTGASDMQSGKRDTEEK